MQLCRVRKVHKFIDCTYRKGHCTWYVNSEAKPWLSYTKLDDEYLVPIPAHFFTPYVS